MSTTTKQHSDIAASQTGAASQQLVDSLDAMVRILRRSIWLRGTHTVLAAALTILLLLLVLDILLQPESLWLRVLFMAVGIGVVTFVARRFVIRPLGVECSQRHLAWRLENEHPEMEERLSSTLQLAVADSEAVSPHLVQVVAEEAGQRVSRLNKDRVAKPPLPAVVAASTAALVVALSFLLWPQFLIPSLQNLISPWNPRVLPHLDALVAPGDAAIVAGEALTITASNSAQLDGAAIEILSDGAVVETHPMSFDAENRTAESVLPSVTSGFVYRVRSSRLCSRNYRVEVLERPIIEGVSATIEFPEYMQQAAIGPFEVSEPIAAPTGSRITLSAQSTSEVTQGLLTHNDNSLSANRITRSDDTDESIVEWDLTVTENHKQEFTLTLSSGRDVDSAARQIAIVPVADEAPGIAIVLPVQRQLTATPDQQLPIRFEATDDVGITAVRLVIRSEDEQITEVDVPIPLAVNEHHAETILDLAERGGALGDNITAWLTVTDNRPELLGGQQTTHSETLQITIDDNALPLGRQVIDRERQLLQKQLTEAIELLRAATSSATSLTDSLEIDTSDEDTNRHLARTLRNQIRDARDTLRQLNDDQLQMFQPQLDSINDVVAQEIAAAQAKAARIPLTDSRQAQKDDAAAAQQLLAAAIAKLEAIAEELAQTSRPLELAAKLDDLARQQNALAQATRERGASPAEDLERDQRQQQIADNLQELVDQDVEAKSQQYQLRADLAETLAEQAAELAERQRQLAQIGKSQPTDDAAAATDEQKLMELLAREQQAIARDSREANTKNPAQSPQDGDEQPQPAKMDAAHELMDETARELRDHDPQRAEQTAQDALDAVKEQAPDANADGRNQATIRQQERLLAAIDDVNDGRLQQASSRLQEQIADRTKQLHDDAQRLLEQPSDDEENLDTMDEAKRTLNEALKKTAEAEQGTREQNPKRVDRDEDPQSGQSPASPSNSPPSAEGEDNEKRQSSQSDSPPVEGDDRQNGARNQQKGRSPTQQAKPSPDQKREESTEPKEQDADRTARNEKRPQPANSDEQQQQAQQPNDLNQQPDGQQAQQNESNERQLPRPQRTDQQADEQDARRPNQGEQTERQPPQQAKQDNKPRANQNDQLKQQQKQAARTLQQAAQSLEKVCKSCQKCAQCTNPSSSSSGGSRPSPQTGNQSQPQGADPKSARPNPAKSSDRRGKPSPEQLARAADAANRAGQSPSQESIQDAARELNQLADDAARQADYPLRQPAKRDAQSAEQPAGKTSSPRSQPSGSKPGDDTRPGLQPGRAAGVGQTDAQEAVPDSNLRARSTGNWIRRRTQLSSNVLGDRQARVPEQFRDLVEGYFEELSRQETRSSRTTEGAQQ